MPRGDPLLIMQHCKTNISIFFFFCELKFTDMFANLFSILQFLVRYVESVITLLQISGALLRLPIFCRVFFALSLQSENASETSLPTYCVYLCF